MRGDTQAQNDGGRDGASPKGQHAWGKGSEGQAVVHRARRDWQGSPGAGNLHSAQIDLLAASWRLKKAGGIIRSKSEGLRARTDGVSPSQRTGED